MNKKELIESLKSRGFSKSILEAFSKVPRENFVPEHIKSYAYIDNAQPIGEGQTISQPYTIAMMLSMLDLSKGQKILEVGSGSGYVLALINTITKRKVYGIEIVKELAEKSKINLQNYDAIVYNRDGSVGLPKEEPFDRILISAACSEIPKSLISQLKDNGIIVAPVGNKFQQSLTSYKKINNHLVVQEENPGFIFVPFIQKNDKVN